MKPIDYRYARTYVCPPDCGGVYGDEYDYVPFCPKCGKELDADHRATYCEDCGYKLDWSTPKPKLEEPKKSFYMQLVEEMNKEIPESTTTWGVVSVPEFKSVIWLDDHTSFKSYRKFNWFQRLMCRIFFGIEIINMNPVVVVDTETMTKVNWYKD